MEQHVGRYLGIYIDIAAFCGRIVVIGYPLEDADFTNVWTGIHKNICINLTRGRHTPDVSIVLSKLIRLIEDDRLHIEVAREYDFADVSEAQRAVINDDFVGKIVLVS